MLLTEQSIGPANAPMIISIDAEDWEELKSRVEFWHYRHQHLQERFTLTFNENGPIHLQDKLGQSWIMVERSLSYSQIPASMD